MGEKKNTYVDFCQVPQLEHLMCQRNLKLSSRKDDFKYIYDVHLWIGDTVDLFWGFFQPSIKPIAAP